MGLDMYLKRSKRVDELTPKQYAEIDNSLPYSNDENAVIDIVACSGIPEAIELETRFCDGYVKYHTIFTEVGYWRKANHIHNWFVKKVQSGVDECETYEVSKKKLQQLLDACKAVKDNPKKAAKLLPTSQGFFFGGSEYNDYYYSSINTTIEIIEKVLEETDFDTHIIFYRASW